MSTEPEVWTLAAGRRITTPRGDFTIQKRDDMSPTDADTIARRIVAFPALVAACNGRFANDLAPGLRSITGYLERVKETDKAARDVKEAWRAWLFERAAAIDAALALAEGGGA